MGLVFADTLDLPKVILSELTAANAYPPGQLVSVSDQGYALYVSTGSTWITAALGSNAVNITGTQTVAGAKTFTDTLTTNNLAIKGPRPWVDVRAYGAIGDGNTNDTAAIQAAIDAIGTTLPGGGVVFFPAGRYRLASGLTRISNVPLIFRGVTASSFNESDAQSSGSVLYGDAGVTIMTIGTTPSTVNHRGPVFENLQFREIGGGKTSELVRINNTNRWTFRNCGFRGGASAIVPYADNGSGPGVGGADCSWGFIENCWISDCAVGLKNAHGVNVTILGGDWEATTAVQVYPAGSLTGAMTIIGAFIDGATTGIDIKGANVSVLDCFFEGCTTAVSITHDAALHANSGSDCSIRGGAIISTTTGIFVGTGCSGTFIAIPVRSVGTPVSDSGTNTITMLGGGNPMTISRETSSTLHHLLLKNGATSVLKILTDGANSVRFDQPVSGGKMRFRLGGTAAGDDFDIQDSAGASLLSLKGSGVAVLRDGLTIQAGTTTGTKIGTATTQKLSLWDATPVVQPTAVADATDAASVITQLNALLARLRTIGLLAT